MEPISLKFMIEKREGHGEDSNPLSLVKENFYAVGVFDGLGGAGAATCKSDFGDGYTKAYIASRIIEEAISNYINNIENPSTVTAEGLKSVAKGRLEQEKRQYPTKTSGLRSKLVREYPTTLAIATAEKKEDGSCIVSSYWAGDSRNYLWTSEGFYQITKDDLDADLDPLQNLRNDAVMSNCVCEDRDFCINKKIYRVEGPSIILSATDGCFGYFPTPMHFENVLRKTLVQAANKDEWEDYLKEEIKNVTADDVSLSLLAIGVDNFDSLKNTFFSSDIAGFSAIDTLESVIKAIECSLEENKSQLKDAIQNGWEEYKMEYMKRLEEEDYVVQSLQETSMSLEIDESSESYPKGEASDVPIFKSRINVSDIPSQYK